MQIVVEDNQEQQRKTPEQLFLLERTTKISLEQVRKSDLISSSKLQ